MRRFLKTLLIFGGGLLAYMGLVYAANRTTASINVPRIEARLLIAGDSQVQRALRPDEFDSARNIAQDAEPYFISYWKLEKVLGQGRIETVLLGFDHHQISDFNDRKLIDPFWSTEMFRRIYAIEDIGSLGGIEVDRRGLLLAKVKHMGLWPRWVHDSYLGSYRNSNGQMDLEAESVIARHYFYHGGECGISTLEISRLRAIVDLCRRKGIRIVLIAPPVNERYFDEIPENFRIRYDELKREFEGRGVEVWDYSLFPMEDSEFLNADHLNDAGARRFSRVVARLLEGAAQ